MQQPLVQQPLKPKGFEQFLLNVWNKLNGYKATIGLGLMLIEDKLHLPDTWEVTLILFIIYTWTGVGLGDKFRQTTKGQTVINAIKRSVSGSS